ncbi:MAG: class I SAM-dependent methyltransferase [bacterium]|nr:MAG: class I SAM-dependent methyltransferase [bacterium]
MFDDRYGAKGYYDIYKCKKCGFGRTAPALKKEKIGAFYKKYYPLNKTNSSQIKRQVDYKNNLKKWLLGTNNVSHLYVNRNSKVLDIGSASGVSLLEIKALGSEAYGVEPDSTAQIFAKKLGLNVYNGFISDNPFPKLKFDFVTASQVIEHEPNPLKFLLDIKKKLKTDGKVILTFPNSDALYRKLFGRRWIHWHIPYHINHFSKESIIKLAKKADLKILNLKTITPNLWTLIQIRCLFYPTKMGKKSDVWDSKSRRGSGNTNFVTKVAGLVIYFANKFAPLIILPVNRVVDALGHGESFLIELEPK